MAYFNNFPHARTYDADLGWLIRHVRELMACCNDTQEKLDTLMAFYDDIMSGDFPEAVTDSFKKWIRDNLVDLVGELVKQVYFGLTPDGYFVAYIPESWDDIRFNTTEYDIFIPGFDSFGHLVLSY